jgi:hypothetical protein
MHEQLTIPVPAELQEELQHVTKTIVHVHSIPARVVQQGLMRQNVAH